VYKYTRGVKLSLSGHHTNEKSENIRTRVYIAGRRRSLSHILLLFTVPLYIDIVTFCRVDNNKLYITIADMFCEDDRIFFFKKTISDRLSTVYARDIQTDE